jgi:uncharacterized protein YciI
VRDRVSYDMRDVIVSQAVDDLAATSGGRDQTSALEHLQMLRHQGLGRIERADQLVNAAGRVGEQIDEGQADRRDERLEQRSRGLVGRGVGAADLADLRTGPDMGTRWLDRHPRTVLAREPTCEASGMPEWIYFLHPPRENFAATMTEDEQAVWANHFAYLKALLADGVLIMAGPTLGQINTGVTVIEAVDEAAARAVMESDPVIISGFATGELRGFRASLLRGRA